ETLPFRHGLVEAPVRIRSILRLEIGLRLVERGAARTADAELLEDRSVGRKRAARGGARLSIETHLALQRRQARVRIDEPGVADPGRAFDSRVTAGPDPHR